MTFFDGNRPRRVREQALVGGGLFLLLIFWFDVSQPPTVAAAVLYVLPVVLGLLARSLIAIIAYALAGSVLTVVDYSLSTSGAPAADFVIVNNLLVFVALWTAALVSLLYVISSQAYERKLEQRAVIDPLTEIYNRRHLTVQLDLRIREAIRYGAPLSVLLIDLDGFKEMNDRYGHLAGDRILRHAADLIAEAVRGVDLVGRYGGDEFLVIMPRTPVDDAVRVAERIRQSFRDAGKRDGARSLAAGVTVSIGVTSLDRTAPTVEALVDGADRALYQAKRSGRDQVVRLGDLRAHGSERRIG